MDHSIGVNACNELAILAKKSVNATEGHSFAGSGTPMLSTKLDHTAAFIGIITAVIGVVDASLFSKVGAQSTHEKTQKPTSILVIWPSCFSCATLIGHDVTKGCCWHVCRVCNGDQLDFVPTGPDDPINWGILMP